MSAASVTPSPLWQAIMRGVAATAVVLTLVCWSVIAHQYYPDPDDILRRLEVRDLLAGQSWWDVGQHRLSSGMMHWSRLVDLPLAAVILPLRAWLGELAAERVAMVIVPLTTLGATMALVAHLTRRLLDEEHARLSLLIVPLSVPILFQMRPMRIDHHGWQIVLSLAALLAFVSPRLDMRSGAIGGAMLAALLTVSLEGLPTSVALLALLAFAWALDPTRRGQLLAATWSAFGVAASLHLATRGPLFLTPACDAMAPVWLAVLGVAAAATSIATAFSRVALPVRFALLAMGAAASGTTLLIVDARCAAGPFGMLDPLVRSLWYDKVSEGLPIWDQTPVWAAMSVGLPLIGLFGALRACRAATGERRAAWLLVGGAQVATLLVSLEVSRAGGVANAFAAPGGAIVALASLKRARAVSGTAMRIFGTAGALLTASPGLAAAPLLLHRGNTLEEAFARTASKAGRAPCTDAKDPLALSALPPARLFAPIDIAPEIIAGTNHRAIASGHHRNAAAMRDVIRTFTGDPAGARRIIEAYHADYIVGCPGFIETGLYDSVAPRGFWARLERGERFDWLQPVPVPRSHVLAWRVIADAPLRNAAPRS